MQTTKTPSSEFELRLLRGADLAWVGQVLAEHWGGPLVVSRGRVYDATQLPGFVSVWQERPVGLANYHVENQECELVTLLSLKPGLGIGSALVAKVKKVAVAAGCRRLWLITTNDNLPALRFYQRRGFRLAALHANALAKSRRLKPTISLVGLDGIPLRDEIELEMILEGNRPMAIVGVNHVQITIPRSAEPQGRQFYCQLLGLTEIEKPDSLKERGGFWLQVGDRPVHVGTEEGADRWASKAHVAYEVTDLSFWRQRLEANGVQITESVGIPGYERLEIRDPFGNRIELIQPL